MTTLHPDFFDKIANPNFALAALHDNEPRGEFKALVRFAEPDKCPPDLQVMEIHGADLMGVRIPCDQIGEFVEDGNVLRIELREYVSEGLADAQD